MKIPTVTTRRLALRAFSEADVDALHLILNGRDVLRYFPPADPPSRERVQKRVLDLLQHWEARGYGVWAVESRATGELMGRCGLQYLPEAAEVEVDYLLGNAFWGQGFATEAARASLRYGFEELGLETVVGIVHVENGASRGVLEKLGMMRVEEAQYFGIACYRYAIERSSYDRICHTWEDSTIHGLSLVEEG